MTINAQYKICVTLGLDKPDIDKLLKGEQVYIDSRYGDDMPILAQIYCEDSTCENESFP